MSNYNNQNNFFNFNNYDNSNNQFQNFPHDNLFNRKLTDFPGFNLSKQNNKNIDYQQQFRDEKNKERSINQSLIRFTKNYGNKIKSNQNNGTNLYENGEVFIDEYINLIKEKHKDYNSYEDYKQQEGIYNFSTCPFCGEPAFFKIERVTCINKCFMTSVCKNTFDKNYTLDNFMEQYKDYYSKHQNCKSDLLTLYVDNESKCAEFLCFKCEKDYISF